MEGGQLHQTGPTPTQKQKYQQSEQQQQRNAKVVLGRSQTSLDVTSRLNSKPGSPRSPRYTRSAAAATQQQQQHQKEQQIVPSAKLHSDPSTGTTTPTGLTPAQPAVPLKAKEVIATLLSRKMSGRSRSNRQGS